MRIFRFFYLSVKFFEKIRRRTYDPKNLIGIPVFGFTRVLRNLFVQLQEDDVDIAALLKPKQQILRASVFL